MRGSSYIYEHTDSDWGYLLSLQLAPDANGSYI